MEREFEYDASDYAMAVKSRGKPERPWAWEVYVAGKSKPVETSKELFTTMSAAVREGKLALQKWKA